MNHLGILGYCGVLWPLLTDITSFRETYGFQEFIGRDIERLHHPEKHVVSPRHFGAESSSTSLGTKEPLYSNPESGKQAAPCHFREGEIVLDIPSVLQAPESLCSLIVSVPSQIERTGVRSVVCQPPTNFHLLAEAETIEETIKLVEHHAPALLLFAHRLDAKEKKNVFKQLHKVSPYTKILATIGEKEEFELEQFIHCNVVVFFKSIPNAEMLLLSLQSAMSGAIVFDRCICPFLNTRTLPLPTAAHSPLTKREKEVVDLLLRGMSNRQIAQQLVLDVDTVKGHVSHIIRKCGVKSRTELVISIMTSS